MFTMGDVARTSVCNEDRLYKLFGVDAEILIDHAWGYEPCTIRDIRSYAPSAHSIFSGQVLPREYTFAECRTVLREMADALALDLVSRGLSTDTLTLDIGYGKIPSGYVGKTVSDAYGRAVPAPAHGTASIGTHTSSSRRITEALLAVYDRIADRSASVRRISIAACGVLSPSCEQLDLFSDPTALSRERDMQRAMLMIRGKYGKNAVLRGTSLSECATGAERNVQIGGHSAERRRGKGGLLYE